MPRRVARPLLMVLALLPVSAAGAGEGGGEPRNIILMIADGCGFNHQQAAGRWEYGSADSLAWTRLPVHLAVSTYPAGGSYDPATFWDTAAAVTRNVTDSAAAVTALTTGRKTRNGRLAIDDAGQPLETVVAAMERGGRATGLVTSVELSHATPAGCAVSAIDRDDYLDISREMITRSRLDVLMGAGHPLFGTDGRPAAAPDYEYVGGADTWQGLRAGTTGGDADGDGWPDPWTLIEDAAAFTALGRGPTPARVIGVARVRGTLQQQRAGDPQAAPFIVPVAPGVPTLRTMAEGALNVLDDAPGGFFLMVEGGAIDWASHDGQAGRMVEEVVGFEQAVLAVMAWIDGHGGWQKNLLIVTADHDTGYLTGPLPSAGPAPACRFRLPLVSRGRGRLPELQWNGTGHTNALVALFAGGAGSGKLTERTRRDDPVRGNFLDNTDVGSLLQELATREPVDAR